ICIVVASVASLIWVIPAYTPPYPGYGASPALVPNVAVGIMLVMAVLALVRNGLTYWWGRTSSPEESEYPDESQSGGFSQVGRAKLWHLARFMIPCALLLPAVGWIGFLPTAFIFMLVMQYLVGRREPVRSVILAVVVVAFMYVAMRYGFNVPVPGA
ncbi:MAG: tripartite tricarboxylate transporter TctB family protein, partial [Sedimenticolaceae bacterium]